MVDELEMEETPIPEQEPTADEPTLSADEEETPIEQQDPDEEEA